MKKHRVVIVTVGLGWGLLLGACFGGDEPSEVSAGNDVSRVLDPEEQRRAAAKAVDEGGRAGRRGGGGVLTATIG